MKSFFTSFRNGVIRLKESPQLLYTLFVAVVIFIAFVTTVTWFLSIANEHQNRLTRERNTYLQDAYILYAQDKIDDDEALQSSIRSLQELNPTIVRFKVVKFDNGENTVIASLNEEEIGSNDKAAEDFYKLSLLDDKSSFSVVGFEEGERVINIVRAIKDVSGEVIGAVLTTQSMTDGDRKLSRLNNYSVIVFTIVIILIMYLFLRHSKIIDYTTLYKKLSEVNQMKDDFISMASHELRTPLTVIRGYADLIKESDDLSPETSKNVERIDVSTKQLDELVSDMLEVSRIEQGRMKFDFKEVMLAPSIDEVVKNLEVRAKEEGLKISRENIENVSLYADPARLRQVLINIIGNSIKYTKEGEIKVSTKIKNDKVIIRISDTGIGISGEAQDKLFEKFYRVSSAKTAGVRGTGLGLWITKQIVEAMRGTITAESIEGIGTHFVLKFPIFKDK